MASLNYTDKIQDEMRTWRRDIHQHPETSYEEVRTAKVIADLLASFGVEVHRGYGKTGVIGVLKRGDSQSAIGLRADIDALNLYENNRFDHCSVYPGKMHACGHDGHTAMLLGAAKYLSETQNFDGIVYFIFQPAEEDGAGAQAMINDGLFDDFPMDAIYGMHNFPGLEVGSFGISSGPALASVDVFNLEITGVGGHGAFPHLAKNPIITGAQVVSAWQAIINQSLDPIQAAVLNISEFHSGTANSVIPEKTTITGSVRAFSTNTQDLLEKRMKETAIGLCQAGGVVCDFSYVREYPSTINTFKETQHAIAAASSVVKPENVDITWPPEMGAEDFSFYLLHIPGCYIMIGNGTVGHGGCSQHNPNYDFNDEILTIGANYWVQLTQDLLPAHQ